MDKLENMGDIIKRLRLEKNITQGELGKVVGLSKQAIMRYEKGLVENMKRSTIAKMSAYFGVAPSYLMGMSSDPTSDIPDNIIPIKTKKVPLLGEIACGKPIFADQQYDLYVDMADDINADFCLVAKGDSMINARINDGDLVFIREQSVVNNGEIAAVIIDEYEGYSEATLKRVYYYPEKQKMVLNAENPKYEPIVFVGEEMNKVRILGKAVAFQSQVL